MKRIFIVFAMLIACFSMTMAQEKQASIKFEKINYNFGKFSERASSEMRVHIRQPRHSPAGNQPGHCKLRMHHPLIHQDSDKARREGRDKGDIQRPRHIPRTLQEDHYRKIKRRNRAHTSVHRRRNGRSKIKSTF